MDTDKDASRDDTDQFLKTHICTMAESPGPAMAESASTTSAVVNFTYTFSFTSIASYACLPHHARSPLRIAPRMHPSPVPYTHGRATHRCIQCHLQFRHGTKFIDD